MDRITVTVEELKTAFAVWLKTMPSRLWRPYQAMLEIDRKRRTDTDLVDPREILAEYMAERFTQAKWSATFARPASYIDLSASRPQNEEAAAQRGRQTRAPDAFAEDSTPDFSCDPE